MKRQGVFEWMESARKQVSGSAEFRELGSIDLSVVFIAGRTRRVVVFEAFEVAEVRVATDADVLDAELTIKMKPSEWSNYLRRRRSGKLPTLQSTALGKDVITAKSPVARLHFDRVQKSIQAFVDAGARFA